MTRLRFEAGAACTERESNMLELAISGKFMEERLHLRWGELLEGMDRGVIGPATVVEAAMQRVSAGDARREAVEIAGAGSGYSSNLPRSATCGTWWSRSTLRLAIQRR